MKPYCIGIAKIRCETTDVIYEIKSDELEWDVVDCNERQMGQESHYEATIDHPELGELTWSLWEYPTGMLNCRSTNAGPHEVIADFDYGLEPNE